MTRVAAVVNESTSRGAVQASRGGNAAVWMAKARVGSELAREGGGPMASTRADSATTRVVLIAARSRSARRPSLAGRVGAVRSAPGARWLAVRIVGEGVVRVRIMVFSGLVGGSWGAGPAACRPLGRPLLGGCFGV